MMVAAKRNDVKCRLVCVYALIDPRDGRVRYIGSAKDPCRRLQRHLADPVNSGMAEWLSELRSSGLRPRVVVIDHAMIEVGKTSMYFEHRYIDEYAQHTGGLLNRRNHYEEMRQSEVRMDARSRVRPRRSDFARARRIAELRNKPVRQYPEQITYGGKSMTRAEWARHLGISRQALHQRMQRHPLDVALKKK